jgi:hypothetical protein
MVAQPMNCSGCMSGEFYSVFSRTEANGNLDWHTWVIGIEYVDAKPYLCPNAILLGAFSTHVRIPHLLYTDILAGCKTCNKDSHVLRF